MRVTARGNGAPVRCLDNRAVQPRVSRWQAQFDDIGARHRQSPEEFQAAVAVRIARRDECQQSRTPFLAKLCKTALQTPAHRRDPAAAWQWQL